MNLVPLAQGLTLIAVANGAPVLTAKLLGGRGAWPVDAGCMLADGQPLLGRSKTIRGVIASLAATPIAAVGLARPALDGALIAVAAMAGDLLASFCKRRLRLPPSSRATGLDQIPESLLPCLLAAGRLNLSWSDIGAVVALFLAGEIVLSRLLFRLGLRDRPY